MKIGLVGYGHWGPNLARNFASAPGCAVAAICDSSEQRLALAAWQHPSASLTGDWTRLVDDRRIDAVAIATPADRHFDLALAALRSGKHVFVEKPLAPAAEQVMALIHESRSRGLVLMVDHTYAFSSSLEVIADLLARGSLGAPRYLDSIRLNHDTVREDANVLWDLAPHDLAILDRLIPVPPRAVAAVGGGGAPGTIEHSARMTLFYPREFVARVQVSWVARTKVRRITIGCSERVVVWNDLEPHDKVVIRPSSQMVRASGGHPAMATPRIPPGNAEPLQVAARHFLHCVQTGARPVTDGESALRVTRLLEAAERSMAAGGTVITLDAREEVAA